MSHESPRLDVDWMEVNREAHELELRHGRDAFKFAVKLADQADRAADTARAAFWNAVSASLAPR